MTETPADRLAEDYRDIVESLGDVVYEIDADGVVTYVSQALDRVLGFRPEEIVGRKFRSFLHPDDRDRAMAAFGELRNAEIGSREYRLGHRDGSYRWVRTSSRPRHDGNRFVGIRGVLTDVTDLRESHDRLRLLGHAVRSIGEGVCVTDAADVISFVNEPFARIFGYSVEELVGQSIRVLRPPEFPEELAAEIGARTAAGGFRGDVPNLRKDGSEVVVSLSTSLVTDEDGAMVGQVGVVRDVTNQRRSEAARRASETRYRALFEASSDGVMLLEGGRFLEGNSAAAEMFGLSREQLIGKTPWDISPELQPDGRPSEERGRQLVEAALAGEPQRFRWRHRRLDGAALDVEVSLNRVEVGELVLLQALVRDVTRQAQAEDIERKRLRQLGAVSRVARKIAPTLDASAVQKAAVEEIRAAFEFHNVALLLFDGEAGVLGRQAVAGAYADNAASDYVQRIGEGLIGAAAAGGATVLANDVANDRRYIGGFGWETATRSEMAVPVKLAGTVLGVLDIQERTADAFDEVDVQTLETLADQIALSLHNARLYQQLETELEERRRTQEALRESEESYRDLVETASDLICTHDLSGIVLSVNENAVRRLGYRVDEVVGRSLREFLVPAARPAFDDYLKLIEEQGQARGLMQLGGTDGRSQVWEYSNTLRTEGVERPVVRGFARDVTDRVRTERALRDSEERYRLLAETAHDMILLVAPDGRISYCNQRALDVSGYSRAEVEALRIDQVIGLEHAANWRERWRLRQEGAGGQFLYEIEFVTRDGRRVPAEISSQPIVQEGQVTGILVVARDITERKLAEAAVRSERDRVRQYLDIAPVLFVALDPDGRVTMANRRTCEVLGRPESEIIGADWFSEFVPAAVRGGLRASYAQLMAGDLEPFEYWENPILTATGEQRLVAWRNSLLSDGSGAVIGSLSAGEDVTERKQLEEQLRHAQKMEAMGRLAGGVAHDFNNLLQAMLATVQLLRLGGAHGGSVDEAAGELEEHVRRGASLARQLLLFAKRGVTQPERLDLDKLVTDAVGLLRRLVRENVRVSTDTCGEPLPVDGDRGQLEQVLTNLALNAVDAMPGGGELRLRTGAGEEGQVWLEVADTGHGMDEAVRERIFEPFFTTKGTGKGTGLGLAVVHGIVAQHHGRIEVDSGPGQGSTFRIVLPRHDSGVFTSVAQEPTRVGEPPRGSGERILLVEDSEQIRVVFARLLDRLGYEVLAVESGEAALALGDGQAFDLLVSDIMLQGVSGVDVARGLAERWPGLKVILMSGYAEDEVLREEILSGQVHFLQKPVDLPTLSQHVRSALDS